MREKNFAQETVNISENLLTLRRRLKLSQKDFIAAYLRDDQGKPLLSVPALSNIENGGALGVDKLAAKVAEKTQVDGAIFLTDPDSFAKNIDFFFNDVLREEAEPVYGGPAPVHKAGKRDFLIQAISDYLADAIIRGELRPGSKLPSDRNLGLLFGVGRTSIREALKVFSSLGIVTILPGQGTFIASKNSGFFHAPLSWTFLISENSAGHIIDVRNELEAVSARLAAERADKTSLATLTGIYEKMKIAFDNANFKDFLDLDLSFHLTIALCSHNPIIHDLLVTSRKMLSYISQSGMVNLKDLREIYDEHGEIYAAIVSHKAPEAQKAMEVHLSKARKRYQIKTE
jgi:DNA-binding FadR family transcriptional regulator